MAKEFRNVKMSAKVTENAAKLDITVDVSEFMQGAELPISSTGVTYNVASTFGGHKLDAELDGLIIDLKVYTKKEYYEKKLNHLKQTAMARAAHAEFSQNKEAQAALANLGLDPAMLAQAIGIMQTLQAQQNATK
jgi:hypothetical protein